MPARRFFALFKAAKEIESKRQARMLYELTYVATCAKADQDWITKLASHYRDRFVEKMPQSDNMNAGRKLTAIFGGLGG